MCVGEDTSSSFCVPDAAEPTTGTDSSSVLPLAARHLVGLLGLTALDLFLCRRGTSAGEGTRVGKGICAGEGTLSGGGDGLWTCSVNKIVVEGPGDDVS